MPTTEQWDEIARALRDKWHRADPDPEGSLVGDHTHDGRQYGFVMEVEDGEFLDVSIYDRGLGEVEDIGSPAYEAAFPLDE